MVIAFAQVYNQLYSMIALKNNNLITHYRPLNFNGPESAANIHVQYSLNNIPQ